MAGDSATARGIPIASDVEIPVVGGSSYGTPQAQPVAMPVAMPVAQPQRQTMMVTVPQGMSGGMTAQVQTPSGLVEVQIPQGLGPEAQFEIQVPGAAAGSGNTPNVVSSAPANSPTITVAPNINVAQNTAVVNNVTNVQQNVSITQMNVADGGNRIDMVSPCCACCCAYSALTAGVSSVCSQTACCCNCMIGCCRAGDEGCILTELKNWISCTGCTICKCAGTFCCFAGASAFPCQKDIPCRLTICWLTIGPGCGCCVQTDHKAALAGGGAPPEGEEMER